MKTRNIAAMVLVSALAAPLASQAQLAADNQNFDTLAPAEPIPGSNSALADDGWRFFVNVYNADGSYDYNYGPFPAPNSLLGTSAAGVGGSVPGNQNMGVYGDYNHSAAHGSGQLVQTSVFRWRTIGPSDVGTPWNFQFDARRLNLVAPSNALAFIPSTIAFDNISLSPVPEPSALVLMLAGLGLMGVKARRR